jgi:hypothetical protein
MKNESTFLGVIRQVVGSTVSIEISQDLPSSNPIIDGRLYRIGQIGSFVRIPMGFLNLYGIVTTVGAHPQATNLDDALEPPVGQRWIEVQLIGESLGDGRFERGISIFPTIDDEVHIVTEVDLEVIYASSGLHMIEIGKHAVSESLPAKVDLDKIVTRHCAIVGATGSGKSNSVAKILRALTDGSFPNASIVVIDPHGEYGTALLNRATIYSLASAACQLRVPYWALSYDELAWFFVGRKSASEGHADLYLRDRIFQMKKVNASLLTDGYVSEDEVTPDSPIPFDIWSLWYELDRKERVTYRDMPRTEEALVSEGDPQNLISATFEPPGAGSAPPYKPQQQAGPQMMQYANKIFARLRDKRFKFLLDYDAFPGIGGGSDLSALLKSWLDHEHQITVFDLGGIPFDVVDLIVGVITRILFEAMVWGRDLPGMGRQRPLLLVYEEAHSYLPSGQGVQLVEGYAGRAVRRVFREGRKYGVGAIVVSQRPSELDDTILSQCGTFISLRLSNTDDKSRVRSTMPESILGLSEVLPALRTGEALIVGEAVQIVSRARIPLIEPRPRSDDPLAAECWGKAREPAPDYDLASTGWRTQRLAKVPEPEGEESANGENTGAVN